MPPTRRTLLALFSIAFGLRILYAAAIAPQPDKETILVTTSAHYAKEIASGADWIKEPFSPRAPGYPMLLSLAFLVSGGSLWAGIILQAILGALTVIVVYLLGERLGGRATAIIAALWLSCYVHHIHFASLMLRDIFACLLLVLLVYLLTKPFRRMKYAVVTGLVYAALIHVEPLYLLLFPAIAVYLLVCATKHSLLNIQYFFLFAGFLLVISLPWTIRNAVVYGRPVAVSLEADNYLGPLIGGASETESTHGELMKTTPSTSRICRFGSNTLEFWRAARFKGERITEDTVPLGRRPEKAWSFRHNLISILTYGWLLPFFILGIAMALWKRNRTGLVIAATVFLYYLARACFGGSERSRLEIEPFIILLAFYALCQIIEALRKRPDEA